MPNGCTAARAVARGPCCTHPLHRAARRGCGGPFTNVEPQGPGGGLQKVRSAATRWNPSRQCHIPFTAPCSYVE